MRLLGKALTFDDVLLVPAYSQVLPKDTSLATRFSRNIALNLPLVSAAMDTVTEARLAIAIAQEGGIGIVHKNLTAVEQAAQVAKVKRYESGVLRDPVVITPQHTVRQGVSNFSDNPIAMTAHEATSIAQRARETKTRFMSASSLRFVPDILKLRKELTQLGDVHLASGVCGNDLVYYGIHALYMAYAVL